MSERPVRVRFAPSPTGDLHVGGARTALFNWLFARHLGGDFILRIEDTDRKRLVGQSISGILESLSWLGLNWDEGPGVEGPYAPYFQSERLELYREHVDVLVRSGAAYTCFCSSERLAQIREAQMARGEPPGYDRHCRGLTPSQVEELRAEGITQVIRFKMPDAGTTTVVDVLRGEITYENRLLEDVVLMKSDGFPTYHLANIVDDHFMKISHVLRGEEWIPSAPLHHQLYRAFGWEPPIFAHLPLILNPNGKGKLSKRESAVGVMEYKQNGYVPEALINYLVLVGWSYDDQREIFSLDDLVELFSLERVSPSPARFSFEKLDWMNQYYINHILTLDDVTRRCVPYLQAAGLVTGAAWDPASEEFSAVRAVVALVKDRLKVLTEVADLTAFFFTEGTEDYAIESLIPRKIDPEVVLNALERARASLSEADFDDEADLEVLLRGLAEELGLKAGQVFMPIRVAVTGRTVSPGLFETLRVLGKDRSLVRLGRAVDKLRHLIEQTHSVD